MSNGRRVIGGCQPSNCEPMNQSPHNQTTLTLAKLSPAEQAKAGEIVQLFSQFETRQQTRLLDFARRLRAKEETDQLLARLQVYLSKSPASIKKIDAAPERWMEQLDQLDRAFQKLPREQQDRYFDAVRLFKAEEAARADASRKAAAKPKKP